MYKKSVFNIATLSPYFATRELAQLVVRRAKQEKVPDISLKDIQSASRSFLDELYTLSQKNELRILDIPEHLMPIFNIIARSHRLGKTIAPVIKISRQKLVI